MRKLVLFALAVIMLAACAAALQFASSEKIFVVTLLYDNGAILDGGAYVADGLFYPERNQPLDGYLARMVDKNSNPIAEVRFNFPLELVSEPDPNWFDESGKQVVIPNQTSVALQKSGKDVLFPYSNNAESVEVYSTGGIRLLTIPLAHLTSFCGDSVCAEGEQCDVDCPRAASDSKVIPVAVKRSFPVLPVVAAVAVVSLAAVFIFMRRRPQKAAKATAPARPQQAQAAAPSAVRTQPPQQQKVNSPATQQQPIKRQMSQEEKQEYYALQQLKQKYGYNRPGQK